MQNNIRHSFCSAALYKFLFIHASNQAFKKHVTTIVQKNNLEKLKTFSYYLKGAVVIGA